MTSVAALVTSLATSFAIFLILLLVFLWLSRYADNAVIYYPARILAGKLGPDTKPEGMMEWLPQAWSASEEDLVHFAGLDAAVYIRLHTTCLKIMLWAAIYCLLVLLPVNATAGFFGSDSAQALNATSITLDRLSMGNIPVGSQSMWAHALGAWWVTLGALYFLHSAYHAVAQLRARQLATEAPQPEQLAVLLRDIPKPTGRASYAELVDGVLSRAHGPAYKRSLLLPRLSKVLDKWKELEATRRRLTRARALLERSKRPEQPQGQRPRHRTGFLGLWGEEVDSLEVYSDRLEGLAQQLAAEQERLRTQGRVHAAVALFTKRTVAAAAGQVIHGQRADQWAAQPAPAPADVVWENVPLPLLERQSRTLIVFAVVALTILFYMIPITFISGLTTLDNLKKTLPFLEPLMANALLSTLLQAYLPQLALTLFLLVLPYLLHFLSHFEGLPSQSHIVRAAISKYYYFVVFNIFLGVTLAGGLFEALEQVLQQPSKLPELLGASLPSQATFFITFIALSFLVRHGLELSQLARFALYQVQRRLVCVTEEELREAWHPGPLRYLFLVPTDLLVVTLGLCYAVTAPMVLPFAAMYHAFSWIIMKHQALNVYVAEYDSGGRLFPQMHSRIVAALLVSQLTMLGYFGLKQFVGSVSMLPLPILTVFFLHHERRRYLRSFKVNSLEVAVEDAQEEGSGIRELEAAYTPRCLKQEGVRGLTARSLIG